jgi:hypothetical protein
MTDQLDVLLLLALPASGKSEVRRYLAQTPPEIQRKDFHLGDTAQLDDYPYVHMMRRISQEMRKLGGDPIFFIADDQSLIDARDWGTLVELLNEDFTDLMAGRHAQPASAGQWLLERYEAARAKVGIPPTFGRLPDVQRAALLKAVEADARKLVDDRNAAIPASVAGRTVVIEAARGGPDGASMPLPAPLGYRYSLAKFSAEILARASILYIWVTPAESRRKNTARTDPNDPGSILHHGVPMSVMLGDYGCDDMAWLIEQSDRPDTVQIEAHGRSFYLPVARFDNRVDHTSFVRADQADWKKADVDALHGGLAEAFGRLIRARAAIKG